ncbi:MAG TPA: purine-nucleoside phosphorylase [Acidimicrobiales bacterium]|nr:purine-nucleoside phosphorylase [Acidimicrobiales bacterium]
MSGARTPADAYERASAAAEALATRTGVAAHDVFVVLGSGWRPAAEQLGEPSVAFPASELPGFLAPAVEGHGGELRSVELDGRRILLALGRVHAYEGHDLADVVHPVRTAVLGGCRTVVLTNAAGGLAPGLAIGQPVLVSDHLNLTGRSPLTGPPPGDDVGSRFPDMTDAYSTRLRALVHQLEPGLAEGVYAGLPGPQYETPAEIRMLQVLGADLVGMSTVHETVAAHHLGAEVLAISLVTNLAAGLGDALDHEDVLRVAAESADTMGALLARLVRHL